MPTQHAVCHLRPGLFGAAFAIGCTEINHEVRHGHLQVAHGTKQLVCDSKIEVRIKIAYLVRIVAFMMPSTSLDGHQTP